MNLRELALDSTDGVVTSFRLRNQIILRTSFEKSVKSCLDEDKNMIKVDGQTLSFHTTDEVIDMIEEGVPSSVSFFLVGISHNPSEDSSDEVNYYATLQQM